MAEYVKKTFPSLDHVPIAFITAKAGKNVQAVLNLAQTLHKQSSARVGTGDLNRVLRTALEASPPPMRQNRRAKVYYATQVGINPPTIVLFTNGPELLDNTYLRYILRTFRDHLPFPEVTIRLELRKKVSGVPDAGGVPAPRRTPRSCWQGDHEDGRFGWPRASREEGGGAGVVEGFVSGATGPPVATGGLPGAHLSASRSTLASNAPRTLFHLLALLTALLLAAPARRRAGTPLGRRRLRQASRVLIDKPGGEPGGFEGEIATLLGRKVGSRSRNSSSCTWSRLRPGSSSAATWT